MSLVGLPGGKDRRKVMRRFALGVVTVVGAVLVSGACFAQRGLPRRDYGESEACYVLVEKAGYEVTCNVYATKAETKDRAVAVAKENRAILKANKEIDAEVRKLQSKIAAKGRALAKAEDDATKTTLKEEIASLKAEVEQKKGEKKPYIKLIGPRRFSKRADADAYIAAVQKAAEKARAKAEAKKEKEKT